MTSKISSVKLLKESLKRNGAIAALLMLVYFVAYPLAAMIEMRGWDQWDMGYSWMQEEFCRHLAYSDGFLFFTICFAAIMGILQFAYLHNREKLDFYHSFPVRREKLFGIQYVSGVVTWIIPYAVNLMLALLLGVLKGYADGMTAMQTGKSMVVHLVCFLVIYSFMVLAMMMTGKIFTAILGMGVFMAYVPVVLILAQTLCVEYFVTYVYSDVDMMQYLQMSPLVACVEVLNRFSEPALNSKYLLLGLLLLALLVTGICVLLYRRRSTESAGRSMAFYKAARVIKFGLVIAASVASQLVFFAIGKSMGWSIFGLLFGFVLSSALVEFIYRLDIREVFSDKRQILLSLAVVIFIFLFFQFDLFGYDNRIPNRSKVESVSIGSMSQPDYGPHAGTVMTYNLLTTGNNAFVYEQQWYESKSDVPVTNVDAVYDLLEQRKSREEMLDEDIYGETRAVYFNFHMKDGSETRMRYEFDEEIYWQYFGEIWADREYREASLPVFTVGAEKVLDVTVGSGYYYEDGISVEDGDLSLYTDMENLPKETAEISASTLTSPEFTMSREQKEALYEALKEEVLEMTVAEFHAQNGEEGLGFANIVYVDEEGNVCGETFRITNAYEKTAALLKEFGYDLSKNA